MRGREYRFRYPAALSSFGTFNSQTTYNFSIPVEIDLITFSFGNHSRAAVWRRKTFTANEMHIQMNGLTEQVFSVRRLLMRWISKSAAARPISYFGCHTVVNAGHTNYRGEMSSYPTTERHQGSESHFRGTKHDVDNRKIVCGQHCGRHPHRKLRVANSPWPN